MAKTKWYWYVARDDELMMDLDGQTLLEIALKRLNKPEYSIPVRRIYVGPSTSKDHYHMAVQLAPDGKYPLLWRLTLQLYLMDHVYRSVKNFTRALTEIPAPSLLISSHNWQITSTLNSGTFWRAPDALCLCPVQRHKSHEAIWTCPAHTKLRGERVQEKCICGRDPDVTKNCPVHGYRGK